MGGRLRPAACRGFAALALMVLGGCATTKGADPAVMESLAEMEIRIRLLQSELTDVRRALAESVAQRDRGTDTEGDLQTRLDDLQQRIAALPETLAGLCPALPESTAVNTACEPEVQRVVVSGDKLVVGEVERVWVEPPAAFLVARIDAAAEYSFMHAEEVVEFERDGNKWVRFGLTVEEETVSVERPLKRFVRTRNERRPVVDLRVQVGDVRETVEFALADLSGQDQPVVLGRNFLTDVALLDVGRKNVQPAFNAPDG
jgi:hypothetical protein